MSYKFDTVESLSVFLSESLGTALLVFLGCMGCISWGHEYNHLQTVLTFGLVVLIVVQIFGCVSGAHINPAVTVAAYVYNLVSKEMACLYIIAQILGAYTGYGLLILITPAHILNPDGNGLCVTRPHPMVTDWQAFIVEFIATSALIWFCCGIWDPRNAKFQDSIPLKFGLAITGLAAVTGPFSGASLNPARSFGPAIWNADYRSHWIYWIAPLSASLTASLAYKYVFRREIIETQQFIDDKGNGTKYISAIGLNHV